MVKHNETAGTLPQRSARAAKHIDLVEIAKGSVLIIALIGLLVLGTAVSPTFLSTSNMQNIMLNVSILGVLAVGQTVVMLVREVDLSIGSQMAFGPIAAIKITGAILALTGVQLIQGGNYVVAGMALILILTIVVNTLVGLVNGVITVKGGVPSLIVTLGMLYALRGTAYVISGGYPLYFTKLPGFTWLGTTNVFGFIPVSFIIFLVIGLLSIAVLKYTKFGPRIYSTGGNEKAAIYSGVNTGMWKIIAFLFCGFCAGIAALVYCSRLASVEAAQASTYEMSAIAIAVIGGTTLAGGRGTMRGTILASIILAVIINIIALKGLVIWYQTIIIGLIIIAAVFAYLSRMRENQPAS